MCIGAHLHEYTNNMCVCAPSTHLGPVCVRARCTMVSQCVFDIYSGPPVEQVSLESTTCSSAPTRAKEPPTDANTHTHTAPAPRSSDMVSECVRPVDGGRLCLHEGKYKRKEVGSPANMCIRSKRWTILYPRPAGCQREAAIHKSA